EVSASNWSAFNNISTLLLWDDEEDFAEEDFHEIINAKIKLIRSDFFNDFILSVADQTYAVAPDKQIEIYLDKILKELPALGFDSASAIGLFEDCDNHVRSYVLKSFTSDKITTLENIIEKAKAERNKDSGKAYLIGKNLLIGSKPILDELK